MMCLYCDNELIWQSDFTCDDVYQCACEEGLVTFWACSSCGADYQITLDCKGD
jgi:hypothetical protein